MTELYLTLNNATAARAAHADFCAGCDGPSEDAVAALGRCPTPAPSDVVDARRGAGARRSSTRSSWSCPL